MTTPSTGPGGRTARSCESCFRRHARWYCTADDAFLCEECDATIHSANPLAQRHHRIETSQPSSSASTTTPAWHNGFKRKPRTPRPHHHFKLLAVQPLVPELETLVNENNEKNDDDDDDDDDDESQLLYRVPIFDPILSELFSPPPPPPDVAKPGVTQLPAVNISRLTATTSADTQCPVGLRPSEVELADFAADMERLLGGGIDDETSICMEDPVGTLEVKPDDDNTWRQMKSETDDDVWQQVDTEREMTLELNFDREMSSTVAVEDADQQAVAKRVSLKLDYEGVIADWSARGGSSPWTDGQRPELGANDCWPDEFYMRMWNGGDQRCEGAIPLETGRGGNGGREARVMRYREKRRTRLFSKKIRYEVRKLNAEKRPRLKGRFVKKIASFAGALLSPD